MIRISEKLDSDSQQKLTKEIADMLTSEDISEEDIEIALAEISEEEQVRLRAIEEAKAAETIARAEKNKIEIGYDSSELVNMDYYDVKDMLEKKGVANINVSSQEIVFDPEKENKCTQISINETENFNKEDRFNPDDEIIIYYLKGKMIRVPDCWMNLMELHYEDVEKKFIDAGFTDITVQPHEVDYDENNVFSGSVINITIGNNATFEDTDEFYTNVPDRIDYRVKPKTVPTSESPKSNEQLIVQQSETPLPDNSVESKNDTSTGGSGVTVPQQEETGVNLVWVPTNRGTKYHSYAGCSGMKDPIQVTLETAIKNGYTACKRCH